MKNTKNMLLLKSKKHSKFFYTYGSYRQSGIICCKMISNSVFLHLLSQNHGFIPKSISRPTPLNLLITTLSSASNFVTF